MVPSSKGYESRVSNQLFLFLLEAFEYLTLDLNKVPGQGLGLSIVGRR